jgi:GxxExxY protein
MEPHVSNWPSRKGHDFGSLSGKVIAACIDVQRQLGLHCMEVDYQRALEIALPMNGLQYQREVEIGIAYEGVIVSKRRVDFLIGEGRDELILETKARSELLPEDAEQCLLYLHQGGYRLCVLVNFGQKPLGIQRFVHTPKDRPDREDRAAGSTTTQE